MKNQFTEEAEKLIRALGGQENVVSVSQCLTHLHFRLHNDTLAQDDEVEALDHVLRVFRRRNEYRVVLCGDVSGFYRALLESGLPREHTFRTAHESGKKSPKGTGLFSRFFDYIALSMAPLIPAMLAGSLIWVLTTLLVTVGWLSVESSTYAILSIISSAFFLFLPIFLAASTADRLGSSRPLAMLIAAILVHPELSALFAQGEISFFSLPVRPTVYTSSVLPILLLVPLMKFIEDFAERVSPALIRFFFKPFLTILIAAPLALLVVGPLGAMAGELFSAGMEALYSRAGWLAVALLAALIPFVALTGTHHSLLPLATVNLTTLGYDPLVIIGLFCSNLAQGGASLAVALRTRDRHSRQVAVSSGFSAIVAGIFEPALYGVNLRRRTPLLAACIAAGVAGLFAGYAGLTAATLSSAPALFAPIQLLNGRDENNRIAAIITLSLALFLSFTLTLLLYREKAPTHAFSHETHATKPTASFFPPSEHRFSADGDSVTASSPAAILLSSPLSGRVILLDEVHDESFAEGLLGKGCAIRPADGHLYSPVNGKLLNLFDTHHALTILSEDGAELLIHVGCDTVSLGGRHFTAYRKSGDELRTGDLILSFDLDTLDKDGFDLTTPLVITNSAQYDAITLLSEESVIAGDPLLELREKNAHQG